MGTRGSTWAWLALTMSACGWNMIEPTDVVQVSDELSIHDRSAFSGALANESFKLGSYQVADVDRKWNRTSSSAFLDFESSRMKGGYSFHLVGSDTTLQGECATEEQTSGRNLGHGASFSSTVARLGCRCSDAAGEATLTLSGSTGEQYGGTLSSPDITYQVTAITQRSKGWESHDPLGYRVDAEQGSPIGAVDLKRPGKVWISKVVTGRAREELACMFAGLLLFEPSKER
jgi:hypothetical protein